MSYVALATDRFEEMVHFYADGLLFATLAQWDRSSGRGRRLELGGLRLEILDNRRERQPLSLLDPGDRFQLVVEVEDIQAAHRRLTIDAPEPRSVSWGARMFQLRDPDGVPVTFLQWTGADG